MPFSSLILSTFSCYCVINAISNEMFLTFLLFQPYHGVTQVQETLAWITMNSFTGKKLEPYRNGTALGCREGYHTQCYLQLSILLFNTRALIGGLNTGPPDTPHPLYYGKKTSSCDQVQELLPRVTFSMPPRFMSTGFLSFQAKVTLIISSPESLETH